MFVSEWPLSPGQVKQLPGGSLGSFSWSCTFSLFLHCFGVVLTDAVVFMVFEIISLEDFFGFGI